MQEDTTTKKYCSNIQCLFGHNLMNDSITCHHVITQCTNLAGGMKCSASKYLLRTTTTSLSKHCGRKQSGYDNNKPLKVIKATLE